MKKIDLFIKLDINLEETFGSNIINNPSIYTNIIVGDIMRVNQKNKYVLLILKKLIDWFQLMSTYIIVM